MVVNYVSCNFVFYLKLIWDRWINLYSKGSLLGHDPAYLGWGKLLSVVAPVRTGTAVSKPGELWELSRTVPRSLWGSPHTLDAGFLEKVLESLYAGFWNPWPARLLLSRYLHKVGLSSQTSVFCLFNAVRLPKAHSEVQEVPVGRALAQAAPFFILPLPSGRMILPCLVYKVWKLLFLKFGLVFCLWLDGSAPVVSLLLQMWDIPSWRAEGPSQDSRCQRRLQSSEKPTGLQHCQSPSSKI